MYCLMVLIMFGCWAFADNHDMMYLIAASIFAVADSFYDIGRARRKELEYKAKFHEIVAEAIQKFFDQYNTKG